MNTQTKRASLADSIFVHLKEGRSESEALIEIAYAAKEDAKLKESIRMLMLEHLQKKHPTVFDEVNEVIANGRNRKS